jgi:ribosome-associated heat shock protein Hsp15
MLQTISSVRVDKWLWAARFFKTRQLAIKALKSSQIQMQKQNLKPATNVQIGDVLIIKRGVYQIEVEILGLSDKRGPAKVAQTLYQETKASIQAREKLKSQLESQPRIDIDRRKPNRRGVRSQRALKRGD